MVQLHGASTELGWFADFPLTLPTSALQRSRSVSTGVSHDR
jgi:hypothetical protein